MAARGPDLGYVPGPGIHVLSAMGLRGSGLLQRALPHLKRMKRTRGLDAALGVLWRESVCYLYHSAGGRELAQAIGGHGPFPAARSRVGRVILAHQTDREVRQRFAKALSRAEMTDLLGSLAGIRARGYLVTRGTSISMAIGTPATAGLTFIGRFAPAESRRLVDEVRAIVADLAHTARDS
jgi:DNA-binding IclR family transcriptional regulator